VAEKKPAKKLLKRLLKSIPFVIIIVFVGIVLAFINELTGNPISKSIAKNKLQQYVKQVYSPDFTIDRLGYVLTSSSYEAEFYVNNESLILRYDSNSISDENVNEYFQEKSVPDYNAAIASINDDNNNLEMDSKIYTHIVANGRYSNVLDELPIRQWIYFSVKNFDKTISEKDSKQMPGRLAKQFIDSFGEGYNFRSIKMFYIDKFGVYDIIVNNKTLTQNTLLRHTHRRDDKDIGEEEKALINGLN